jgi:arylformamidase
MTRIVDLSHPLEPGMPHARTIPAAEFTEVRTWQEHRMRAMRLDMPTHIGTHLDAPSHFVEDGATIDQLPLSALVGRAYCVQVLREGPDPVSAEDIRSALDMRQVTLEPDDALLIRTGWDQRYAEPEYVDRHAYLAVDAAEWAVAGGLRLIGVDTITPEFPMALRGPGHAHDVHRTLLGAGTLIVENLVLNEIPDQWITLIIGALLVLGGDGAPARALAITD